MKHILVPTDFSVPSNAALSHALSLAAKDGARVTLLHVIYRDKLDEALLSLSAITNLSKAMDLAPDSSRSVPAYDLDAVRSTAQQNLDAMIAADGDSCVTIETAIGEGRPSHEIVDFARDQKVDLICMGTHGRGPVGRMFLGSVTENVVRTTDCPVLVVRKPKSSE